MLLNDLAAAVGVKNVLREDKVVGMPLCVASWLASDEDGLRGRGKAMLGGWRWARRAGLTMSSASSGSKETGVPTMLAGILRFASFMVVACR